MIFTFFITCIVSVYSATVPNLQCKTGCESKIYCDGDFLKDVQLNYVYDSPKKFIDMKLLRTEDVILSNYKQFKASNLNPTKEQFKAFLDHYFDEDGLEECELPDFSENAPFLESISDKNYKKWIHEVIKIWKDLAGKVPNDAALRPDKHSYLYVPNCFIKAGGFFTEMYYWDTYWILRGLLLCDMQITARGIIENFFHLVQTLGYVPNANRKYYIGRSQPPLLTRMVNDYYQATNDEEFLINSLETLEKEFEWWYNNRMVDVKKYGKTYRMARYNCEVCAPRPEAFTTDYHLGEQLNDISDRQSLFVSLRTSAESGWDFSSRGMRPGFRTPNTTSLLNWDTQNIVMVDLNAFLHYNAAKLASWYKLVRNTEKAAYYQKIADNLFHAIQEVLWNEDDSIWYDWDLVEGKHRKNFYPSNFAPLWTQSFNKDDIQPGRILEYLAKEKIISDNCEPLFYGVPTSSCNTDQQWDYLNEWAPLQSIMIEGLRNLKDGRSDALAFAWSALWLKTNYYGFMKSGNMYEKYNAITLGESGNGGDYAPQIGFGWTNGLNMILLHLYGDEVASNDFKNFKPVTELKQCALLSS